MRSYEKQYQRNWTMERKMNSSKKPIRVLQTISEEIEEPYQCQLHDTDNSYTPSIDHRKYLRGCIIFSDALWTEPPSK